MLFLPDFTLSSKSSIADLNSCDTGVSCALTPSSSTRASASSADFTPSAESAALTPSTSACFPALTSAPFNALAKWPAVLNPADIINALTKLSSSNSPSMQYICASDWTVSLETSPPAASTLATHFAAFSAVFSPTPILLKNCAFLARTFSLVAKPSAYLPTLTPTAANAPSHNACSASLITSLTDKPLASVACSTVFNAIDVPPTAANTANEP